MRTLGLIWKSTAKCELKVPRFIILNTGWFQWRIATLSPSDLVLQLEKHSNLGTDFISNCHTILSKPGFNKETLNLILFQWSDFSFERDLMFNNPNPSLDLVSEWFWAVIWILINYLSKFCSLFISDKWRSRCTNAIESSGIRGQVHFVFRRSWLHTSNKSEETKIQFRFIYIAPFQGASYCKVKTTILERNPTIRLPPSEYALGSIWKEKKSLLM